MGIIFTRNECRKHREWRGSSYGRGLGTSSGHGKQGHLGQRLTPCSDMKGSIFAQIIRLFMNDITNSEPRY